MTDAVTARLKRQAKTDVSLIPGGLTKQLQPADVSWNKPFKGAYGELYSNWMANGEKSYTPTGNMRAPDKLLCLQWVKEAWKSVTTDIIVRSFRSCGISVNIDGSEDSFIHCLKPGEAAYAAADRIKDATSKMLEVGEEESDEDPFADIDSEDEEELENNELLIDDC